MHRAVSLKPAECNFDRNMFFLYSIMCLYKPQKVCIKGDFVSLSACILNQYFFLLYRANFMKTVQHICWIKSTLQNKKSHHWILLICNKLIGFTLLLQTYVGWPRGSHYFLPASSWQTWWWWPPSTTCMAGSLAAWWRGSGWCAANWPAPTDSSTSTAGPRSATRFSRLVCKPASFLLLLVLGRLCYEERPFISVSMASNVCPVWCANWCVLLSGSYVWVKNRNTSWCFQKAWPTARWLDPVWWVQSSQKMTVSYSFQNFDGAVLHF